jgi:hypothetical protein
MIPNVLTKSSKTYDSSGLKRQSGAGIIGKNRHGQTGLAVTKEHFMICRFAGIYGAYVEITIQA